MVVRTVALSVWEVVLLRGQLERSTGAPPSRKESGGSASGCWPSKRAANAEAEATSSRKSCCW